MVLRRQQETATAAAETEIDLLALLKTLWYNKWVIILVVVVFASIGFIGTREFITPTYRSSFTAFINNRNESAEDVVSVTSGDTSAAQSLTYTYAEIIKSRPILEEAAKKIGLSDAPDQLRSYVTTSIGDRTQLVYVYITMDSPEMAAKFGNAIAEVAPAHLEQIVEGTSMKIVAPAQVPDTKFSPSIKRNVLICAMLGFVLCAAIIIIHELLDTRIKDQKELSEYFGLPIIGTIPNFESASGRSSSKYGYYGKDSDKSKKKKEK